MPVRPGQRTLHCLQPFGVAERGLNARSQRRCRNVMAITLSIVEAMWAANAAERGSELMTAFAHDARRHYQRASNPPGKSASPNAATRQTRLAVMARAPLRRVGPEAGTAVPPMNISWITRR